MTCIGCGCSDIERDLLNVWVCLLPCLPLHVSWIGPPRHRVPKWRGVEPKEMAGAAPEVRPARTAVFTN